MQRPSDGREPQKIAWIQCVGSRDSSLNRDYCSYVCCMYATKQAMIAKEHLAGLEPTIFFIDIRAQGKGFDRYYERAKGEHGVRYVRSLISRVTQDPRTHNLQLSYIDETNEFRTEEFDLVILSVGLTPHSRSGDLADRLQIEIDRFGFCENPPLDTTGTTRPGIFTGGVFQNPKDIPETVTQASGAAAAAAALLQEARGTQIREMVFPEERPVQREEPRVGVFICHCGINIAGIVDVAAVAAYARTLPGVVYTDHLLFTCSTDSQENMLQSDPGRGLEPGGGGLLLAPHPRGSLPGHAAQGGSQQVPLRDGQHPGPMLLGPPGRSGGGHGKGQGPGAHGRGPGRAAGTPVRDTL